MDERQTLSRPNYKHGQCRLVLKDDRRCSRPAIMGSIFCWSHVSRGNGWLFAIALSALTFLLGIAYSELEGLRASRQELATTNVSRARQLPRVIGLPARIVAGITFSIDAGLEVGATNLSPYSYRVNDRGEVFINGLIHDKTGVAVAELRDSTLFVPPGLGYDVNSDEGALEVIAPDGKAILQVIRASDGRSLQVNYVAYTLQPGSDALRLETAIGTEFSMISRVEGNAPPARLPSDPIFRYPGYEYPGIRR